MSSKVVPTTATTSPRDSDASRGERMSSRSLERLLSSAEGSNGLPSLPHSPVASWRAEEVLSEPDAANASETGLGLGLPTATDGAGVSLSSLASTATPLEWYQREADHSTRGGRSGGGHSMASSLPKVVARGPGRGQLSLPPVGAAGNSVLKPGTIVSAPGPSSSEQAAATVVLPSSGGTEKSVGSRATGKTDADASAKLSQAALLKASGAFGRDKAYEVADAKREGGGGPEGRNNGPHLKLKTVAVLTGLARPRVTSYAEEHDQDISAEINSLSTISAHDDVEEVTRFLLHHESTEKLAWDIVMMVLIIFSSFVNPLKIGFDITSQGALLVIEVLVDFAFIFHIGLIFRTTVMDAETKETITDVREISARQGRKIQLFFPHVLYLKGWFVLDVVSSLPVALIAHMVDVTGQENFFYMLKLLRTLKLHQLSVISTAVLQRFEDRDFNPSMFRIYIFVFTFVLVVHFIACGYWFVSRTTDPEFEGLWVPEQEYLDAALYLKYARALYFSLVITYGNDLKPENDVEYMFSNICLTLALLTNAVIIGSATNLLSNMDAGAVAKKTQMDGINGYMRFRKARRLSAYLEQRLFSLVPKGLQKRIRTFYEYLWDSGQDSHSCGLFEEMPEKLKLQLNIALKKRLIDQVPLFKTFSPSGTIALVQNLIPSIILPGELIVRQGEPATCMFFISRGSVRVTVPETEDCDDEFPEETYIISLGAGSFFGEVALLEEEHLRTANVRAEAFTELQVMHATDFKALAEVFPEFKTAVKSISSSRVKAGESLGKMKARGKKFSKGNSRAPGPGFRSMKTMRNAVAAVKANHRDSTSLETRAKKPKMVILVERLMGRYSRSVYETVVQHEALVSHEAAIRVARGGGIAREDLLAMNHL
ncbi:unnamed protein product [Ectocarpus fasciculatus]